MEPETINILRALCSKVKEMADLFDALLVQQENRHRQLPKNIKEEEKKSQDRKIPLSKWNDYHPWPTVSSLHSMSFSSYKSGVDYFIKKIGGRLIVDEKKFFEWCNMSDGERIKNSPDASRWENKHFKK